VFTSSNIAVGINEEDVVNHSLDYGGREEAGRI
jgi:hypothetical protein